TRKTTRAKRSLVTKAPGSNLNLPREAWAQKGTIAVFENPRGGASCPGGIPCYEDELCGVSDAFFLDVGRERATRQHGSLARGCHRRPAQHSPLNADDSCDPRRCHLGLSQVAAGKPPAYRS